MQKFNRGDIIKRSRYYKSLIAAAEFKIRFNWRYVVWLTTTKKEE